MSNLVAIKTSGGDILVEAEVSKAKQEELEMKEEIIGSIPAEIESSFKSIAETIKRCSVDLAGIFDEQHPISKSMKSAEIDFGIKVSGEGNVYVAKAAGEANITVRINWEF